VSSDENDRDLLPTKRQFSLYTFPYMDRPNLTVLTNALVTRLTFAGKRAAGVEIFFQGKTQRIGARVRGRRPPEKPGPFTSDRPQST
jgi:choline dehydrogenase-like flavoprotein